MGAGAPALPSLSVNHRNAMMRTWPGVAKMCEPRVLRLIAFIAPLYAAAVWAGIRIVA